MNQGGVFGKFKSGNSQKSLVSKKYLENFEMVKGSRARPLRVKYWPGLKKVRKRRKASISRTYGGMKKKGTASSHFFFRGKRGC